MSLAGRVALVTGGGRGIGRAIAVALATRGARVAVNFARDAAAAGATAEACRRAGGEGLAIRADAALGGDVARLLAETEARLGPVDVLVANMGLARDRMAADLSVEDWDATVAGTLRPAFLAARAVLPGMLARGRGTILAVSSVSAAVANPGQSAYAAAKAGLHGLVRTVAREAAPAVRANALLVGLVETEMTAAMTPRQRERALDRVPLGRMGTPAEVAAAAAFLADDELSGYVTGAVLAVDGGLSI